jgi:hypothetical protein
MSKYFWSSSSSTDPTVGANWTKSDGTTGTAPASGDDAYVQAVPGVTLASIGASNMSAVALNSLTIGQSYTGTIGTSAAPGGYWQIGAATVTIGAPTSNGSNPPGPQRVKLDVGASTAVVNVIATSGFSVDTGFPVVRLLGSAMTTLNVVAGQVGLAVGAPGETSTVTTINQSGGLLSTGPAATWTTANIAGGTFNAGTAGTTLNVATGATAVVSGSATLTTASVAGTLLLNNRSGGTDLTTGTVFKNGSIDVSGEDSATTIDTLNQYSGGSFSFSAANPAQLTITTWNRIACGTITAQ